MLISLIENNIMSSIQDIHSLELRITDIVNDYIQKFYNENDVLAINRRYGKIILKADDKDKIKVSQNTELLFLKELVRIDDNGDFEADCDKISNFANSWLFL